MDSERDGREGCEDENVGGGEGKGEQRHRNQQEERYRDPTLRSAEVIL